MGGTLSKVIQATILLIFLYLISQKKNRKGIDSLIKNTVAATNQGLAALQGR